ncbi:LOW QUALITY PROTEIN: sharpin [Cyanocitta cristata]
MAAPGAPGPGPAASPPTVLMAARAELAAPCRLLPAAGAALRLQLSVEPGAHGRRRFRLGLRLPEAGGGAPLAEFDLRDVSYRVCGPTSHELELPPAGAAGLGSSGSSGSSGSAGSGSAGSAGSAGTVALRFPEEREAQQWWTVLSSSLREARRAPEGDAGTSPVPPAAEADPEEARTLELAQREELALRLAEAIAFGDEAVAAQSAAALARQHAELSVRLRDGPAPDISMPVGVEDATSSASITLRVQPHITISTLKEQVFREYGFHPLAQRWIIGQSLCSDGRSLGSYGIRRDGDPAFLFLLSARAAGLSPQRYREQQAHGLLRALALDAPADAAGDTGTSPGTGRGPEPPERVDIGDIRDHLDSLQLWDGTGAPPAAPEPRPPSPEQAGWPCPRCPFPCPFPFQAGWPCPQCPFLFPFQAGWPCPRCPFPCPFPFQAGWPCPRCPFPCPFPFQAGWPCPRCPFPFPFPFQSPRAPAVRCAAPPGPRGTGCPGGTAPTPQSSSGCRGSRTGPASASRRWRRKRQRNFQQLLQAEEAELVPNPEPLECGICLQPVPAGRGVLLRDCLHSFCRECLRQVITLQRGEPLVPCPFRDATYACASHLQEREIRALLSPEEHARFLARGLALAERRSRNSFHCRGRDCPGWCFYEDAVNEFPCPVCGALNCLLCKAIHEGQNCRQYQDELQLRALDDAAARQTRDMLQTLVPGEAMHCPTCRIVVQKKDGCDWIRCTVCQTEICWVTKGPRWGPAGPGDTSGGCRCNINGQRCHPQCQNCH